MDADYYAKPGILGLHTSAIQANPARNRRLYSRNDGMEPVISPYFQGF